LWDLTNFENNFNHKPIMAERPEDLNLPSAVVSRIIKEALPQNVKVSKEAQAAVAKAASVFVLYATSCANNVAIKSHRKTIHGTDVIKAMEDMEFDKFIKPLEGSLDCE
jgi:DNA polymerase epsilon subunit 3